MTQPADSNITSWLKNYLHLKSQNFSIGDSIEFNPKWSLLIGVSHAELQYLSNWSIPYKKSVTTPSISLVYKPIENLSFYSNYMEGMELGGMAAETYGGYAVVNANQVMNPLMSKQMEVGAKYTLNDILFTAALFNIDKGLEYYDLTDPTQPRYVQSGRQVHKGLETTATGKITDRLTVFGGVTLLDAKIKKNKQNQALEGKRPANVADKFAKLYLEYTPFEEIDLALNTGINYTAGFYGDNLNTDHMPDYTLVNIGARYTTKTMNYPITYRLNFNNVFDKQYWVNNYFLGDRRTIAASMTIKF